MATPAGFPRWDPVLWYFVWTFAISWGGIVIVVGPHGIPSPADPFPALPFVYLAMLAGPAFAGLVMTGVVSGRAGFRDLFARLSAWRVGAHWYAVALLTAPLLTTVVLITLSLRSSAFLPAIVNIMSGELEAAAEGRSTLLLSMFGIGLVVALFEELGWTGFATPPLRRRHGVLMTGVVLGLVWGAWHFLVFWESETFREAFPLVLLLARLFSVLVAYRVLMVWAHDRTGSLLVPILMHAAFLAAPQARVMSPATIVTTNLALAAVLWGIIGTLAWQGRLSPRPTRQPITRAVPVEGGGL